MSFRKNDSQQISMFDSFNSLTFREQKALERSWAKTFADEVFPMIDEERFSVLYSDKASRPNTPVNVIIGALVLKELFDLSDDEVVEDLLLDPRFQYALHTTSFDEQPLSDKSLTRFRQRCYDYEQLHGIDLYHDCVTDLGKLSAKLMKIDGRIRRMDSLMVESNIRKLSRMELIYRCISRFVMYLHKNNHDPLLKGLEHYYDPDDFNRVIYHSRSTETDGRMAVLLRDADILQRLCSDRFDDVTEYQLLVRCLSEQTIEEGGVRRLRTKADGQMGSDLMQSPADPDATYREKAGKSHRGYVANIEESVGENGSVVTDYQFETNNTSDSAMLKNRLKVMDRQEEPVIMIADGAYAGESSYMEISSEAADNRLVAEVLLYLEEHYAEDISLADLSAHTGKMPEYLCAAFRKETGDTIMRHLTEIRIGRARQLLLENPDLPVYVIGQRCGFRSPSYFGKVFRDYTGTTPQKLSRRHA